MNPKDGWLSRAVGQLLVFVLSFLTLAGYASASWKEVLYSFRGYPDGATPVGGVASTSKETFTVPPEVDRIPVLQRATVVWSTN
jgi:hypothetical protein